MTAGVEFWFDFASTYSYLAAMQVEDRARAAGVPLAWRPFLLGPIFRAQGWDTSPFVIYPARGRYMQRDMARLTAAAGLPWTVRDFAPQNSLLAARAALAGEGAAWLPAFVRGLYLAKFGEGRDIARPETVAAAAAAAGAPDDILERATRPANKQALIARTDEATRRGIFGAPSFLVGDELFWGHDRMDEALAWAAGRAAPGAG